MGKSTRGQHALYNGRMLEVGILLYGVCWPFYAEIVFNLSKGELIRIDKGDPRLKMVSGRNGLEHHDRLRA